MADRKQFAAGEVICAEGKYENFMYVINTGKAGVYAAYGTPRQKELTVLEQGSVVGELGLLEAMPRSATVVALEDVTALKVTAENFSVAFKEHEDIIFGTLTRMADRLVELTDDYMEVCAAIAEYVEAEKAGAPEAGGLLARIREMLSTVVYY